jgi:hypothetical protein
MHRHDSRSPQVNAHFWLRLGLGIPSISTAYAQAWRRCAQVIHMFVHRQQGSSRLVCGQAARIGTVRRYLQARPTRRVRASETRWHPCRVRTATAGLRSSAGGSQAVPLVGTDMIKVLANPTTTRCRWLANSMQFIGCCGIHVSAGAEPRYLCDASQ